jgi:glycosyl transferase family 25
MSIRTAIRVISLEDATSRQAEFWQQAEGIEIGWSFFRAYTELTPPLNYSVKDCVRRFGRPLSKNEIACSCSHYKVWEWFLDSDYDQLIVLEDDILVDWNYLKLVSTYDFNAIRVDFLKLFTLYPFKSKSIIYRFLTRHHHLLRVNSMSVGAQGYLMTKSGAKILCDRYKNIEMPIDEFIGRYWISGLPQYMVFPFPILEKSVKSTIGGERSHCESLRSIDRICYFFSTLYDNALKTWAMVFNMNGIQSYSKNDKLIKQFFKN